MINLQATATDNQAGSGRTHAPADTRRKLLLEFLLFALCISLAGGLVFQRYKEIIKRDKQDDLAGIAQLKINQINNWSHERKGEAQALTNDPLLLPLIQRWLQQGAPANADKAMLIKRLMSLQDAYAEYGYTSISLFDTRAVSRLSTIGHEGPARPHEVAAVMECMRTGQTVISDIHSTQRGDKQVIEIDVVAPLRMSNGKTHMLGAVMFRADPRHFLLPLVQEWPTPSQSAENLLVRRDGDDVLFLSELRHLKGTMLTLRLPMNNRELPAARALSGQTGLMEGRDYRGVPVLSVLHRVPGTDWAMVSKIDLAEVNAPINSLRNWLLLLLLMLTAAGGGVALFWWRKQQQYLFMLTRQHEQEIAHQALTRQLDYLAKYANDIILLLDDKGMIVEFNDRALEAYGYTAEEFARLSIYDLRADEYVLQVLEDMKQIRQTGAMRYESVHMRKNGETFHVESSVRMVDIGGREFQQAILRDVTARKKAEEELTRQKNFIRQVIDSDPNLVFVKDADGRFLFANETMAKAYGQTVEGIVGKRNTDFVSDPVVAASYESANEEVLRTCQERVAYETGTLADGTLHDFQTLRKPLIQSDGSVNVLTIAMDITELKQAERDQSRLNRALRLLSSSNQAIMQGVEENALLTEVCKLIVGTGGYRMAWVGYAEHDEERTVRPVVRYGEQADYLDGFSISWADNERGLGPTGTAIRTGVTQVNQDFRTSDRAGPWREAALSRGYLSSISIPFFCERGICGALTIYAGQTDAFGENEVELLEELVDNLTFGIMVLRTRAEREQAMERLRQSEEHFRLLTENASDVVFMMSLPGMNFEYISPASSRLFGYSPEEFYRQPMLARALIHPDSRENLTRQMERFREGDVPQDYEYRIIHRSGEERWMSQRNTPIFSRGRHQHMIAVQGVVTDITERKLVEAKLDNERIRLQTLVQTMPELVWLKDCEGSYLGCNPQFERFFGAREHDIVGKTDYDFVDKELADFFRQKDRAAMAAGGPTVNEEWITYADSGERVLLETIKTPIRDDAGTLIGVMGIGRDITARKQAEEELRFKNTLLTTEHEVSIEGLLVVDDEARVISHNRRFCKLWGVSEEIVSAGDGEEVLQKMLVHMAEPDVFVDKINELFKHHDATHRGEIDLQDGRVYEYYTTPMISARQEYYGRIWYFRDITEQKQAAKELARSYAKLQRLSLRIENTRSDERARIALNLHDEMGAMLAAMKMRVAWLASKLPVEMTQLKEEAAQISELVSGGIQTMHDIVSQLRPELLSDEGLAAAIGGYVKKFRKHTKLECNLILPDNEFKLDEDQSVTLFRILQESWNNVVKHAQAGRGDIVFTEQSKSLSMLVKDNGVGFDADFQKDQAYGLLGIRERALMVGGKARITSKPGKGTRVSISLPYQSSRIEDVTHA
ncbi:MAG: PAS domain S-box protein [Sideroxydans sp.]|nr:PAS domain S-box protein [Sideroxydans sp.]